MMKLKITTFVLIGGFVGALTDGIMIGGVLQNTYFKHYRIINIILALLLLQCAVALLLQ